jgi:membrane-associated phospholipid phosphatase
LLRFIAVLLVALAMASSAWGEDNIFNSMNAIEDAGLRIGAEATQVVLTPIDTDGYGLLGTLATAGAVGLTYIYDEDIREKLQGAKSNDLDKAADVGNFIGSPYLHIGLAAALYGAAIIADSPKYKELGEMLGESVILADATTLVLKQAIGRARPFVAGDRGSFRPFQFKNDYDSMPSMHTASSFAMASVLSAASESILAKLTYYAAATFVGFSRMYKDKHWGSDIVLGAAIGELCGRVVTSYHVELGNSRLTLAPMATQDGVSLALLGRW